MHLHIHVYIDICMPLSLTCSTYTLELFGEHQTAVPTKSQRHQHFRPIVIPKWKPGGAKPPNRGINLPPLKEIDPHMIDELKPL